MSYISNNQPNSQYDEHGINPDKFKNDYQSPSIFVEKIHELKDKLLPIFDSFVKGFVLHNKNPEDNEYKQIFNNDKSNLENIINDQFLLENNISTHINNVNSDLARLYIEIETLKKENAYLKHKLIKFDQHADTSDLMFDNHKEEYELQYLRNWAITLAIFISLGILSSIYKPVRLSKV